MPPRARKGSKPQVQSIAVRKEALSVEDVNLLQDVKLDPESLDTIPDQIRSGLHQRYVRVVDVFRQFDDNRSGMIDGPEFVKALSELGLNAPPRATGAVFRSFDTDGSGQIDYREFHALLGRSVKTHPRLEPLDMKGANQLSARKRELAPSHATVLGGLNLSESSDPVPVQIREKMKERYARVIDVFRQFDEDGSGVIDGSEFVQTRAELGLTHVSVGDVTALWQSFDTDDNGCITYAELHHQLRYISSSQISMNNSNAKIQLNKWITVKL